MIEAPTPSLRTGVRGAPGWLRLFRTRLREAAFWKIQAAVMSITVAHLLIERYDVWTEIGLHHLTVTLYLIPVVYAGLRYGLEGGLLTGAWAIVLTLPNIFIWHPSPIVWSGELLRVFVVTGVGMAVSVPVERERRQSDRLLDTSRRLALLNSVSSSLVSSARPEVIVPRVLERLREVLGLAGVGVASWQLGDESPAREEWVQVDPDVAERLRSLLAEEGPVGMESGAGGRADGGFVAPLGSKEPFAGLLGAVPVPDRPLSHADEDLLGAVAGQIGVALDNARLHRDERDRLRSYVQEVTRAQEEERKRLARELHDTVAQDLVRLVRGLDGMTEAPAARSDEMTAGDLRGLGGAILEDVRRVGRDLRPTVLDDLGLVAGLEWLSSDLRVRSGIEATFRVSGRRRRLPGEVELVLFRIAQEALTNVEKHAGAGTVAVLARFEAGSVRLVVEDDGQGFEPARSHRLAREGRFGLVGMEERARLVGGSIDVRSRPGGGTAVSVEVPLGRGPQLPEQVPEL